MSLPNTAKIVTNTRDLLIFDLPLPTEPPQANRAAVFWDVDRDERILDVVTALDYRDLRIRAHLIGLAESKGRITVWFGADRNLDKAHAVIQGAADAALRPFDRWIVEPLRVVDIKNGVMDRNAILLDDRLAKIPSRYDLGVVRS